jgi:hypothetical protein
LGYLLKNLLRTELIETMAWSTRDADEFLLKLHSNWLNMPLMMQ